jgi:hypothetical protein
MTAIPTIMLLLLRLALASSSRVPFACSGRSCSADAGHISPDNGCRPVVGGITYVRGSHSRCVKQDILAASGTRGAVYTRGASDGGGCGRRYNTTVALVQDGFPTTPFVRCGPEHPPSFHKKLRVNGG